MAMAAAGALWSVMLAFEMRVFVIADTLSHWYFAPVHSPTKGTTLRALGHAAGASFGTLCFASLVRAAPSPLLVLSLVCRTPFDNRDAWQTVGSGVGKTV